VRTTLSVRWTPLVRGDDASWRALFEAADLVSEGSAVAEDGGLVWYGTTSIILRFPEATRADDVALLAGVAAKDVHVKLRALRLARREAQLRAPSSLGRSSCEIRVVSEDRGVRIDVDVQAPLIESARSTTSHRER
jgi:hypothetical protein